MNRTNSVMWLGAAILLATLGNVQVQAEPQINHDRELAPQINHDAQRLTLQKINSVILAHRRLKIRPAGMTAAKHEQLLRKRGLNPENLQAENCALYLGRKLTNQEIEDLASKGIAVNASVWIPPVPGSHPFGFYLATVRYDSLDVIQNDPRFIRLESTEFVTYPLTDLAGIMTNVDDVQNGLGTTARDGSGVNLAIADSGLDTNHADIPTPIEAYDMTDGTNPATWGADVSNTVTYHGTHVTGTAVGSGSLSNGRYVGAAPGASLYFYKIGDDSCASATDDDMTEAIVRARDVGCDILSISYGGFSDFLDGSSPVCQAVDSAVVNYDMAVFAAAGNEANRATHHSELMAPSTTVGFTFTIDNTASGSSLYEEDEQVKVVWQDDNSSDGNLTLTCTNLGTGESLTETTSDSSSRGTERKDYELHVIVPASTSTTYDFTLENTASCGATPLVHVYRTGAVGACKFGKGTFDDPDPYYTVGYPAMCDQAIAVGAWTQRKRFVNYQDTCVTYPNQVIPTVDTLGAFSSLGPRLDGMTKPDLVAPGAGTISARDADVSTWDYYWIDNDGVNDGSGPANYLIRYGTSMACPMAAGAAVLLLEAEPSLTPYQLRTALTSTAALADAPNIRAGWGLIDMLAAINRNNQNVIYVDADATAGSNNGSSWSDAYTKLQDALAAATSGDKIWVADGTYKPDQGAGQTSGDRTARFELVDGVEIYGGFDTTETTLEERAGLFDQTILSGDIGTIGDDSDNSIHVVWASTLGLWAVLDGFTITGGNANGAYYPDNNGGGMFLWHVWPTISNCTFKENSTSIRGGGIYLEGATGPNVKHSTISSCTFRDNYSYTGSGVFLSQSNATLKDCNFIDNWGAYYGGGMQIGDGDPTLINCKFLGNSAGHGAAIRNRRASPKMINCLFSGNDATYRGGGLFNQENSDAEVINCTFSGNLISGGGSSAGAGIYNYQNSSPSIINCILWGNSDSGGTVESAQIASDGSGTPDVSYSCIQGLDTFSGNNNIGDDPQFVDADGADNTIGTQDDDVRLTAGSPSIDAGSNKPVPSLVITDLGGNSRISDDLDTNNTGACRIPYVDMGAYEFGTDCNRNGIPDACDLDCSYSGFTFPCPFGCVQSPDCNTNSVPDNCESDTDGDSVIDACDNCPQDPLKTEPGDCGCGVADFNSDCDTIPDCLDNCPYHDNQDQQDSDGDGLGNVCDQCPYGPDGPCIVDNGDFGNELTDWNQETQSEPGSPDPVMTVENMPPMDNALHIFRPFDETFSSALVRQVIAESVNPNEQLLLKFDVWIAFQNFADYDLMNVYPANVWVDYLDDQGIPNTFRRSFYMIPGPGVDPLPLAEELPPGIWHSRQYNISNLTPPITDIVEVSLGAEGWSYDVAFDNIDIIREDPDCNNNGVPDELDIIQGTSQDCNLNGVPDECDIGSGSSADCNSNMVPDECEPDGDGDTVIDDCDNCPVTPNTDQADTDDLTVSDGFESGTFSYWQFTYSTNGQQSGSVCPGDWDSSIDTNALTGTYSANLYAQSDLSCSPWVVAAAISRTVDSATNLSCLLQFDQIQGSGGNGISYFQITVQSAEDTSKTISYGFSTTGDVGGDILIAVSPGSGIGFAANFAQDYFNKYGSELLGSFIIRFKSSADYAEYVSGIRTTEVRIDDILITGGPPDGVGDVCDNCPAHYNPNQADCDDDGTGDVCAIATGSSDDDNYNGIPDECECVYGDVDGDGELNLIDLLCMLDGLAGLFNCPDVVLADLDIIPCGGGNGELNLIDLLALLDALAGQPACPALCL